MLVDVRNETCRLVATRQGVNGDAPHRLGATFTVRYLPADAGDTNVAVFVPCILLWLIAVPFVGAQLLRLGESASARVSPRRRRHLTGPSTDK